MNELQEKDIKQLVDKNAEAGVVSSLIYHPEFIFHVPYLQERYFSDVDNSCMFWGVRELVNNKVTNITAMNLSQILASHKAVKARIESKNIPSIQEYIDLCFYSKRDTIEEFKLLVDRVVELSFKRDFWRLAKQFQSYCFDPSKDLEAMSNVVYQDLNKLNSKYVTCGDIVVFGEKVDDIWGKIKAKKDRGESYGLPSAFPSIEEYFQYETGELVVIAARMKQGKSILAMMEGIHKAINGVPTFIQDSEMDDELWYIRALSYLSGISTNRIKNERLTAEEEQKIVDTNNYLKSLPIYHNYDPYMTKEKFYSICAQKKIEMGLQFVIWDYIKCSDDYTVSSERSAYMAGITNWLKNIIAGDLKLSVLAFAQLNRGGEVAESDGIEKYCSVSVRWEQKDSEEINQDGPECGTHKLRVRLNRLGKQHMSEDEYIDMKFLGDGRLGIVEAKQHKKQNPFD